MAYPVQTIGELPGLKGQSWPEVSPSWVTPQAEAVVPPDVRSVSGIAVMGVALGGVLFGAVGLWAWDRWGR